MFFYDSEIFLLFFFLVNGMEFLFWLVFVWFIGSYFLFGSIGFFFVIVFLNMYFIFVCFMVYVVFVFVFDVVFLEVVEDSMDVFFFFVVVVDVFYFFLIILV